MYLYPPLYIIYLLVNFMLIIMDDLVVTIQKFSVSLPVNKDALI